MALAIQPDLAALPVYVGFPVYYILTNRKWSADDETMYAELRARSMLFPAFSMRWIFWAVWVVLYPAFGVGGYLLWHEAGDMPDDHYYMAILGCYWAFIMLSFAWMSFYQDHDMKRYNVRGGIIASSAIIMFLLAVALMVLSIIVEQVAPAIIFGVGVVWLAYAAIMSIRIATLIPVLPMVLTRVARALALDTMLEDVAQGKVPIVNTITAEPATSSVKSGLISNTDLAHNIGQGIDGGNNKFQATKLEMPQTFKKNN